MSLGQTIVDKLKEAFPDARMELNDSSGDGSKWTLKIASDSFKGLSRVKQHQAIYKPLRALIDSNQVHALQINTYTLDNWESRK